MPLSVDEQIEYRRLKVDKHSQIELEQIKRERRGWVDCRCRAD